MTSNLFNMPFEFLFKFVYCLRLIKPISILNLFLLHGEAYRHSFMKLSAIFNQIQPKFNGLLVLGVWLTLGMGISVILF